MADAPQNPRTPSSWLDSALVLVVAITMAGVLAGLFFIKTPQENLPIIASIASALMGLVIGGYAGFRWGASDSAKRAAPVAVAVASAEPDPAAPPAA